MVCLLLLMDMQLVKVYMLTRNLRPGPWKPVSQMSDISQITRNVSHQPVYPNNALNKILIKTYLSSCVCAFLVNTMEHHTAITHLTDSSLNVLFSRCKIYHIFTISTIYLSSRLFIIIYGMRDY